MVNVLVINSGSSSIKYQLIEMEKEERLARGVVERIGIDGSCITHELIGKEKVKKEIPIKNHGEGIKHVIDALLDPKYGPIKSLKEIQAVGHRVVHGGEKYSESVLINESVEKEIDALSELAPLHNPANLSGIKMCHELMPGVPMAAVFDTAFHQTMRPEAYLYAIPYKYYKEYGIRKYGFHGTSHKYMANEAAAMLNIDVNDLKIITCHLGNGASVSAIKHGRSVGTSMGYTPLEGLVMGTRCGDIDPSVVSVISQKENISETEVNRILNEKSGVLGVSGISSDFRDLEKAVREGNKRAEMALKIFAKKVRFYIGAYFAEMNGVDAIVFTGGIGENDPLMRELICRNMGNLGIKIDKRNNEEGGMQNISTEDSKVQILIIPQNEELVIARETYGVLNKHRIL